MSDTQENDTQEMAVGRYHRTDGDDEYVIFHLGGEDIRFTFLHQDVEFIREGEEDTIRIKEGAIPRETIQVGPPYHPKVLMPKAILDEYGQKALNSRAKLRRP